jgi:DNA-binding XRE family transcriptional regulator
MASKRRRFAQYRRSVGFTQESLAEALGVERSTVVRWEAGQNEPQPWMRPKIAQALRISIEQLTDLLAGTNSYEPDTVGTHEVLKGSGRDGSATARLP